MPEKCTATKQDASQQCQAKGNQNIMVLVEVDGNYIDAEPMKNKSEGSIIKAYLILCTRLTESDTV